MNVLSLFVFGALVVVVALAATLFLVLGEAADPGVTDDRSLNAVEKELIGKKRERAKQVMEKENRQAQNKNGDRG